MEVIWKMGDCFKKYIVKHEYLKIVILALLVGVITGTLSAIFNEVLYFSQVIFFQLIPKVCHVDSKHIFLIIPLIGGALVGLINKYLINVGDRGFGVTEVIKELRDIEHYKIKPKSVLIKTLGTIITLGSGLSAGKQGPLVYLGGAIGSSIGYGFNYSSKIKTILIGCGVAGSIGGAFNIPITAVLFVFEVIMGKKHFEYLIPILISSFTSKLITCRIIGDTTFMSIDGYMGLKSLKELVFYMGLGIILGFISIFYIKTLKDVKILFNKANINKIISGVIGAAVVVIVGYGLPLIYEMHYDSFGEIMFGSIDIKILIFLLIGKTIATAFTLGSGGIGGVFTPGLFIGALCGSIFNKIISNNFIENISSPQVYALVGIGGMFAGFANAPITATVMIMEFTKNYSIILPVLLVGSISSLVSAFIYNDNIYGTKEIYREYEKEELSLGK